MNSDWIVRVRSGCGIARCREMIAMNIAGEGWFAMIARIVGMSRMQYSSMRIVAEIESAHRAFIHSATFDLTRDVSSLLEELAPAIS